MRAKDTASGFVIGIDLGTQSLKVLVYDFVNKSVVTTARAPLDLISRRDGTREQEASWWLAAMRSCFAEIAADIKQRVVALAVSGQQHGFVAVGDGGQVLAPVKLWNDTSTVEECDAIHAALGGVAQAISLAGNPILPGYTASKVLWLKRHRYSDYVALRQILLPHDYINFHLTGRFAAEAGDASGTGFFDIKRRNWSREVLRAIDPDRDLLDVLPPILRPTEAVGEILPQVAKELGLSPGVVVGVGGGDNMMGAIGTGTVMPGTLTISLGTSGTLYGYAETAAISESQEFAAFCSSTGGYLPLVCSLNCTAATEVMRDLLSVPIDEFDSLLATSQPGAGGIISLPFFNGERTPDCPHSKGAVFGLTAENATRANLMRSVVEATILGLRTGLSAMQQRGLVAEVARVTGGGAHSRQWLQIVADVLNVSVTLPPQDEAAAFGAALQALWCFKSERGEKLGIGDLIATHFGEAKDQVVRPRHAAVECYNEVYRRYLDLVVMMRNQDFNNVHA